MATRKPTPTTKVALLSKKIIRPCPPDLPARPRLPVRTRTRKCAGNDIIKGGVYAGNAAEYGSRARAPPTLLAHLHARVDATT